MEASKTEGQRIMSVLSEKQEALGVIAKKAGVSITFAREFLTVLERHGTVEREIKACGKSEREIWFYKTVSS